MIELAFAAGEWAAFGAAIGVVAASLAAALTAWKLLDRVVVAIRNVVREEQVPLSAQITRMQEDVTSTRDEQQGHLERALKREERLNGHSKDIGRLDARVTHVERHLWPPDGDD